MKKLLSLSLVLVLMLSLLIPSAAAAEGLQAAYNGKTVTVTATGLKADTQYAMISVRNATSVLGLGSGVTDEAGRLEATIPVGPLADGTYEVHIYNNEDGTVAKTGSFTVGEVMPDPDPDPKPDPDPNPDPKPDPDPRPDPKPQPKPDYRPDSKPSVSFDDVNPTDYYYDAVRWAVQEGITQGLTARTFGPENRCTRAQSVTFLWRAMGEPTASGKNIFKDVPADAYYVDAVRWAVGKNITQGMGNDLFQPDGTVTRGQFVTFLWRTMGCPKPVGRTEFKDVSSDAYYHDAVQWAAEEGITQGMGDGMFAPEALCLRGQIVTFLYRYLEK